MLIPTGYAQVNMIMSGLGLPLGAQWTFGVENIDDESPVAIFTAVAGAFSASTIMSNFVNTVGVTGILVKNGPNLTGPSYQGTVNYVGGGSASGASPQVAALVQKRTALGGRRARGRFFLPGVSEANVSAGGVLEPTFVAALNVDLEAFRSALSTASLPMVLLHQQDQGLAPLEVESLSCQSQSATQRRRNRR